ncbi:MAG TPA: ferritin-like domain-containing protein [Polyangiaceae bacterium]|jgi:hypothetical protein|nr:ferritin-like domain-containing protein [Polyangiaceae bacterium]
MAELGPVERGLVADYWWQRALGELTSWHGFQHVLADLRAEHAAPAVIELAERAVQDEHRHAEWCREWAVRFGHAGGDLVPRGERPIAFRGASEAQNRLLRIALCCLNETVGCVVLRHVRPVIEWPELRELNRRHMADELQHSRVGWAHLATLNAEQRSFLRPWVPALLRLAKQSWCEGAEGEHEALVPYGYFSLRLLRAAHAEAVESLIVPGFSHLGLGEVA